MFKEWCIPAETEVGRVVEQLSKKVIQGIGVLLYESDKVVAALLPTRDRCDDLLQRMLRETRRTLHEATKDRT